MAATDKTLGALHEAVAQSLLKMVAGYVDAEGNMVYPTAAELGAAITFLKNNNITAAPTDDNALGELERKLKEKQQGRATPGSALLAAALADFKAGGVAQ